MINVLQIGNKIFINGKEIEKPKSLFFSNSVCMGNNKLYINGKEFKNGKWKYTLESLFYTLF